MNDLKQMYERAVKLAEEKHSGQLDKGGQPYIGHPKRAAEQVEDYELKTIAMLHDIIEDTDITAKELLEMGFSKDVVNAVVILTKPEDMDYFDYIARIKTNEKAVKVKLADLADNMRIDRIQNPMEKDFKRLEKYKKAMEFLKS